MRLALGQPVRVSTEIRDLSTTLTDPDTIVLTVHTPPHPLVVPDVTVLTYDTPTRDSVGKYHQDIPVADLSVVGHYSFAWTTTGPAAGVSPPGSFDVFDPFEVAVLPLQDAKDALNIAQTTTTYDAELSDMIAGIRAQLERITGGPLATTTITERVRISRSYRSLVLRQRPVIDVLSVTDIASGTALALTDIEIDTNAGIVRRKLETSFTGWGPFYTVQYTAGWGTSLPPAFNMAARVLIQHFWEMQQGPSLRPTMGGAGTTEMARGWHEIGLEYAIPNRVLEIMAPYASQVSL